MQKAQVYYMPSIHIVGYTLKILKKQAFSGYQLHHCQTQTSLDKVHTCVRNVHWAGVVLVPMVEKNLPSSHRGVSDIQYCGGGGGDVVWEGEADCMSLPKAWKMFSSVFYIDQCYWRLSPVECKVRTYSTCFVRRLSSDEKKDQSVVRVPISCKLSCWWISQGFV